MTNEATHASPLADTGATPPSPSTPGAPRRASPTTGAHLHIAPPSYNCYGPGGYTPKGGTGVAVRTLVQLAEDLADGTL